MIYKYESPLFLKEILNEIKGNVLDLTYGNGYHSKGIIDKIKKRNFLISFEKDNNNFIINKIKRNNFFLYNMNYNEIKHIKIKKINTIVIDIGYTVNQIKNNYSFKSKNIKNIINLNFFYKKKIKNFLKNNKKLITNFQEIKNLIKRGKRKNKNCNTDFLNFLKNNINNSKKNLLNIFETCKKIRFKKIIILFFNKFEFKMIKENFKNFKIKIKKKNNKNIAFIND
ncbi:hypothetical protein ACT2CI_00660 [Candidatus Vidania fulgoroideorum]